MPTLAQTDILPLVTLASGGVGLLIWGYLAYRRSRLTFGQFILYAVNLAITRLWWKTRISGKLPAPAGQGAMIICNHVSSVDPFFIQLASGTRVVHWMVAKEYFTNWASGGLLRLAESIPVSRGGVDTAAMKLAIRYLGRGDLVGLFPEGKINTTGELLLPCRVGAALMALKADVPVIPCYIRGVPFDGRIISPILSPARVDLVVGEPIDLSPYLGRDRDDQVLEEVTRIFLTRIAALAGQPDYEVQVMGRQRGKVMPALEAANSD